MPGRAQHRAPEWVLAERGLIDEVLGDRRGLVVGARDLLDDDATLAVELVGVDPRPADEIGQQIARLGAALGSDRDVERHQVVARVRVEHRADPLGRLVDVAVGGVLLAALEHEMLQEVGHPVLLGALGPRARVERDQQGQRAGALDPDVVQRQPVLQGRGGDRGHRQECSVQPSLVEERQQCACVSRPADGGRVRRRGRRGDITGRR